MNFDRKLVIYARSTRARSNSAKRRDGLPIGEAQVVEQHTHRRRWTVACRPGVAGCPLR